MDAWTFGLFVDSAGSKELPISCELQSKTPSIFLDVPYNTPQFNPLYGLDYSSYWGQFEIYKECSSQIPALFP